MRGSRVVLAVVGVLAVAEIALLAWLGQLIGVWWTLLILVVGGVVQARALGAGDPVLLPGDKRPAPRVEPVVWMMPAAAVVLSAFAWFVAR